MKETPFEVLAIMAVLQYLGPHVVDLRVVFEGGLELSFDKERDVALSVKSGEQ